VGTGFFGFEEPVENMPQYGLEYGRVVGISALLLCTDLRPEQKERLLVNFVQIGIDLAGMIRAGHPGWTGWGGHGSGRKLPIVFAGLLLGDDELAAISQSYPGISFGEDEQTAYGGTWTGAKVVFAGHSGIDAATGEARSRGNGWGPYEHTPPSQWQDGQNTSESYRRCCTSVGWVAQALALRLMHGEQAWGHDAFFDYVDRWMYEDDAAFVKVIKEATGQDHDKEWARQGQAWDPFVNEMWAKYRPTLQAPIDGWKRRHDDAMLYLVDTEGHQGSPAYSTAFDGDEDPLSEGGRWANNGLDWTRIRKQGGIAYGTQTGTNGGSHQYDDSYAHLSGFPPDQEAWARVRIARPNPSCHQELEILLRWTSSAHSTTGYECFARCTNDESSYVQVVRWEGPLGKFTYLADHRGAGYGLKDGDILKASIVGNVITVTINGVEKARVTDDAYKTGNPGIGTFLSCDGGSGKGSNADFGFTSFTAQGLRSRSQ
jgi:hypothetical protein